MDVNWNMTNQTCSYKFGQIRPPQNKVKSLTELKRGDFLINLRGKLYFFRMLTSKFLILKKRYFIKKGR